MDEQQNENRPTIPTWVWIITIFAVILGLQLWLSGKFSGPEQISMQEVANHIAAGEVKQLTVAGDRLQIELKDGRTFGSVKSPSDSLVETFEFYGISADALKDSLIIRDQSTWNNILTLAIAIGPVLLLIWIFTRGFRQMQGGGGNNIFGFGRSRARNLNDTNRPTVTFDDVAGVEEAKMELAEVVQFLREPEKFVQVGARIPKGVLMVGPPGTG
ncbi:MAG TPA: cell division protein FtsH, partial [Promineifilum sp.]|nr:cell division protein FtsH [Promineifilum sp.]